VEHADNPPLFWEVMGAHRYIYRCPEEAEVLALAAAARQEA
jgi:hypothetical protein